MDAGRTVVDLHSHNSMPAFFSGTDNADEQGFRLYCVIGRIDTDAPEIACRAGVYGHHWPVPALAIFEGVGSFVDTFSVGEPPDAVTEAEDEPVEVRRCRGCGCTDLKGCWPKRCWWVEDDLCSNCAEDTDAALAEPKP